MKASSHPRFSELITARQIQRRIPQLARLIHPAFARDPDWAIVALLNGSYVFVADLGRALHKLGLTPPIDFLALSSYGAGTRSSGKVKVERHCKIDVRNRNILVVDDILDSGRTLAHARRLLETRGARSIRFCVLLDKQVPRAIPFQADWVGFSIPDRFVAGYGLDLDHRLRNLPHIVALDTQP
jgi:hypoxanthine phosphoribosyltransferase